MMLPRLTAKSALSRAVDVSLHASRAASAAASPEARRAGIEPAICPDPSTPLETDYLAMNSLGPVDLARLAQTNTACRGAVYGYVMDMWDRHYLWGMVNSLPVTAPKVLRAWADGDVGKARNWD